MAIKNLIALAWMMGFFLSPEALFLQGKVAGLSGFAFVLPLAVALVLHGLYVKTRHHAGIGPAPLDEIHLLTDTYGPFTASLLLFMARPVVAVCLATAVLVTSGFVFNEVFFYWFPNFGFAALVLAVLLIVNLAGPRVAAVAQIVFSSTAIIGLAGISIVGLFTWSRAPTTSEIVLTDTSSQSIGLAVIVFVGYDLLQYTNHKLDQIQLGAVIKTGLIAGGLLFSLWNIAALLFVAPSRLVDTSIPHILAAKAIWGPTGRIVIGVVAIAGACAAVNYLFQTVSRMMALMAHHRLLPVIFQGSAFRPVFALFGLAAATGLFMVMGFAGSDMLDVSIRAGLILWLVFYVMIHLSGFFQDRQSHHQGSFLPPASHSVRYFCIILAIMAVAVILVATDDDAISLLKTIIIILCLSAGVAGSGLLLARGISNRPALQHAKQRKE